MKNFLKKTLPTDYFRYFYPELTEEEKTEIIQGLEGNDKTRKLDANRKMIDATFNILQSAIGGVMLQYYRDYTEDNHNLKDEEDLSIPLSHFISKHTDTIIALSICAASGIALEIIHKFIRSRDPKSYKISNEIKNRIDFLTPKLLRQGIEDIEGNSDDALKIRMPSSLSIQVKRNLAYLIGGSITAISSVSEDQQYLVYAASLAISKFVIEQFDQKIYKPSIIGDAIHQAILSIVPSECISPRHDTRPVPSITGEDIDESFTEDQMGELHFRIKGEMEKALTKGCRQDAADLFMRLSESFAFFGAVHNSPGSLLVTNDHFASSLDFVVGSIGYNISKAFGENLKKGNSSRITPSSIYAEERNSETELDEILRCTTKDECSEIELNGILENIEEGLSSNSESENESSFATDNHDLPSPNTSRPSSPSQNSKSDREL